MGIVPTNTPVGRKLLHEHGYPDSFADLNK
jgi:hypothetical protein